MTLIRCDICGRTEPVGLFGCKNSLTLNDASHVSREEDFSLSLDLCGPCVKKISYMLKNTARLKEK